MNGAGLFAIAMVVFIGYLWWRDCRKDEEEFQKRKRGK